MQLTQNPVPTEASGPVSNPPRKIHTHLSVDLDAAFSDCAVKRLVPGYADATFEFHPADWDGTGMAEGDIAVDIRAGGRGIKGTEDGEQAVHSAFAEIVQKYVSPEVREILWELTAFIDAHDSKGGAMRQLAPELNGKAAKVLAGTNILAWFIAMKTVHQDNDAIIVDRVMEFFDGILAVGHSRIRAREEAKRMEILSGGKVAILDHAAERGTKRVLFQHYGVRAVVYVDGNNLGLNRANWEQHRMDHPKLRALVEEAGELDRWYISPDGRMFSHGTRKSPKDTPTKVSPRRLAETLAEVLEEPLNV